MEVMLERANLDDAQSLLMIQKQAYEPSYKMYKANIDPHLEKIEEMKSKIMHTDGVYYKIMLDGKLCGGLYVFKLEEGIYKIGNIYVLSEYQSKGVCTKAVAIAESLKPDATEWEADVPSDQQKNIGLFVKSGYKDTGRRVAINDKLTLAFYRKKVGNENPLT